jgi:hypothetical protein
MLGGRLESMISEALEIADKPSTVPAMKVRELLDERPPAREFEGYQMALRCAVDWFLVQVEKEVVSKAQRE